MIPFLYDRTEPSASRQSVKAESSDTEMFDVEPMVSGALADAVEQVSIPSTAENNQLSTPAFPSSTITFRAINHHHGFSRPESSTTPEPPLQMNHTPMASSASPAPKTGYSSKEHDFADFENILDDDILDQIYEAEFDRSWIENYGVQGKFDLFNGKYLSRLKQEDLFRKGALKDGDNFYFETKDQIGNVVKRAVKVVGFQSEKGAGAKTPKIELAQVYPGDPPTGYKCCIGPKEIIKAVQDHYNETHDGKMVWEALTVFEDDETCFGTLHDLRQRYAFWRLVVDRFIDIRGLDGRKRPVMAALSIYKNYEPLYKMNEEEGKDEEEQEEREEEYEEAEEEESEEE
ncbi:MAG: hypothetical protein L6R41_002424 [Letrouitia leprolyta]|nr:MAG: hypothetical protein L6R41_002424 [Letrouitia leprolyta]